MRIGIHPKTPFAQRPQLKTPLVNHQDCPPSSIHLFFPLLPSPHTLVFRCISIGDSSHVKRDAQKLQDNDCHTPVHMHVFISSKADRNKFIGRRRRVQCVVYSLTSSSLFLNKKRCITFFEYKRHHSNAVRTKQVAKKMRIAYRSPFWRFQKTIAMNSTEEKNERDLSDSFDDCLTIILLRF